MAASSIMPFTACFILLLLSLSSALDMSIIDFNQRQGLLSPPKRTDEEVRIMFESWLVANKKNYNALGEKEVRYQIFKDNLRFIDEENSKKHTYELALTLFADLTYDEYLSKVSRGSSAEIISSLDKLINDTHSFDPSLLEGLPDNVDWRGSLGPIRNQGSCGSCWAFSASAAVAAINHIKTNKFVELSPQQLVDCETTYSNGCVSGHAYRAFEWIINNGGITSEQNYPYREVQQTCDKNKLNDIAATIDKYEWVKRNDEKALQAAVVKQPVVVLIDSKDKIFQHWGRGVYDGVCGTDHDHAVVAAGYGIDNSSGKEYWLIKNSWGTNWGEGGYGRIRRNVASYKGKCGIAVWPVIPIKN